MRLDPDTHGMDGGTVQVRVLGLPPGIRATFVRRGWLGRLLHRRSAPFERDVRVVRGGADTDFVNPSVQKLIHEIVVGVGGVDITASAVEVDIVQRAYEDPGGRLPSRRWGTLAAVLAVLLHGRTNDGTVSAAT